jgi:hypothetical protein
VREPLELVPASHAAVPRWLRELLGPERAARADQGPLDGVGYFLLFSSEKNPRILRVFTTDTSYLPDAKAWNALATAGIWTTLTITTATFASDDLVPNEGPFVGTPIQFCVDH